MSESNNSEYRIPCPEFPIPCARVPDTLYPSSRYPGARVPDTRVPDTRRASFRYSARREPIKKWARSRARPARPARTQAAGVSYRPMLLRCQSGLRMVVRARFSVSSSVSVSGWFRCRGGCICQSSGSSSSISINAVSRKKAGCQSLSASVCILDERVGRGFGLLSGVSGGLRWACRLFVVLVLFWGGSARRRFFCGPGGSGGSSVGGGGGCRALVRRVFCLAGVSRCSDGDVSKGRFRLRVG